MLDTLRREDLAPADKQARIKAFAWVAGRLAPKVFDEKGEPEEAEGTGDEGALIQIVVNEGGGDGM